MNPVLERTDRLAFFLSGWALGGVVLAGIFRREGSIGWGPALALTVPLAIIFGFISLSTWYVCRTTPLRRTEWLPAALNLAAAGILSAAFWYGAGRAWTLVLVRGAGWTDLEPRYRADGLLVFELGLLLYALSLAVNFIVIGVQESRDAERQILHTQVFAREAELRALRAQIDPHFLFNALNSVSALTTVDPSAARRMCVLLSDYLRGTVRLGGRDLIPLADEVAMTRQYLDIEHIRFGSRLVIDVMVDEQAAACLVPPLLLQPLVENAVTHGIAHVIDGGAIRIAASRTDGALVLTVENPCDPDRRCTPQTGFGLQNVRKRLEAHFGHRAKIEMKDTPERFTVRLTVPCEHPEAGGKGADRS
jgi:two-component system sensor histidine kinase AlgZ